MSTSRKSQNKPTAEFTQETVEKVAAALDEMARRPKGITLFEIVRNLELKIRASFEQGYSAEDVCAAMKKTGVICSPHTLKKYLNQARKEREGSQTGESSPTITEATGEVDLSTGIQPETTLSLPATA